MIRIVGGAPGQEPKAERTKELFEDIFRLLQVDGEAERANVRASVLACVETYRGAQREAGLAPGLGAARDALDKLVKQAEQLANTIKSIPPYLKLGGATYNVFDHPERRAQSDEEYVSLLGAWRRVGAKLEELTAQTRARKERWPTSGGNLTLHTMAMGPPKTQLVAACYEIFEKRRLGAATSSGDGPFCKFCGSVYELATGQGADDEGVGLIGHVQTVISAAKNA